MSLTFQYQQGSSSGLYWTMLDNRTIQLVPQTFSLSTGFQVPMINSTVGMVTADWPAYQVHPFAARGSPNVPQGSVLITPSPSVTPSSDDSVEFARDLRFASSDAHHQNPAPPLQVQMEDCSTVQVPRSKRRKNNIRTAEFYRIPYSECQKEILESAYADEKMLSQSSKMELAKRTNLQPKQIKIWFQNRRAKDRRKGQN